MACFDTHEHHRPYRYRVFVSARRPALLQNIKLVGADIDRVHVLQNTGFVANALVVTLAELSTASAAPVV